MHVCETGKCVCACMCVLVYKNGVFVLILCVCVCIPACVCVCVRERVREHFQYNISGVNCISLLTVFTQAGLEHEPTAVVPPQEIFRVPKPGTVDWAEADNNHLDLYEATMSRIRSRVEQRRILLKPVFQDFDR